MTFFSFDSNQVSICIQPHAKQQENHDYSDHLQKKETLIHLFLQTAKTKLYLGSNQILAKHVQTYLHQKEQQLLRYFVSDHLTRRREETNTFSMTYLHKKKSQAVSSGLHGSHLMSDVLAAIVEPLQSNE